MNSDFRSGRWVRFEITPSSGEKIEELPVVIVDGKQAKRFLFKDPELIAFTLARMQRSKCGRMVGIYLQAARTPLGTQDQDGNPEYAHMPACVSPQRQVLGPSGEQNVTIPHNGQDVTMLLPIDALRKVEPIVLRDDVPAHRNQTCDPDWNPRR